MQRSNKKMFKTLLIMALVSLTGARILQSLSTGTMYNIFKQHRAFMSITPGSSLRAIGIPFLKKLPPIYGPCRDCRDISFEHVVPKSIILRSLYSDKKAVEAMNDVHNIFAAPMNINHRRSNLPFTPDRPTKNHGNPTCLSVQRTKQPECAKVEDVGNENYIMQYSQKSVGKAVHHHADIMMIMESPRQFSVNPKYRGLVARCALYMHDTWGCPVHLSIVGGRDEALRWHKCFPVSTTEIIHNYIGYKIQGNVNPYIWSISNEPSAREILWFLTPKYKDLERGMGVFQKTLLHS
jgi:endonuclease I